MGLIYLDACLVIYAFEQHPQHGDRLFALLDSRPARGFAISSLVKLECLVQPIRSGNVVLQQHYERHLQRFTLLPLNDEVFVQAAQLRARFGVKTPDALHLACAQLHACEALWTNDERLANAAHGLALNVLA